MNILQPPHADRPSPYFPTKAEPIGYNLDGTIWPDNARKPDNYDEEHKFGKRVIDRSWAELSAKEKIKELSKSVGKLGLVAAGAALVAAALGSPSNSAPDEAFDSRAVASAKATIASGTSIDTYEAMYVTGQNTTVHIEDGGAALLDLFTGKSDYDYVLGQDCLQGTGYDTTPSAITGRAEGTITAAASLSVNANGNVEVYPAGSIAPPLVFTTTSEGLLSPTTQAVKTLEGYGCNTDGIPVRDYQNENSYAESGERFTAIVD